MKLNACIYSFIHCCKYTHRSLCSTPRKGRLGLLGCLLLGTEILTIRSLWTQRGRVYNWQSWKLLQQFGGAGWWVVVVVVFFVCFFLLFFSCIGGVSWQIIWEKNRFYLSHLKCLSLTPLCTADLAQDRPGETPAETGVQYSTVTRWTDTSLGSQNQEFTSNISFLQPISSELHKRAWKGSKIINSALSE